MYRRYLLESSASLESTQYDCLCLLSVKLRAASQSTCRCATLQLVSLGPSAVHWPCSLGGNACRCRCRSRRAQGTWPKLGKVFSARREKPCIRFPYTQLEFTGTSTDNDALYTITRQAFAQVWEPPSSPGYRRCRLCSFLRVTHFVKFDHKHVGGHPVQSSTSLVQIEYGGGRIIFRAGDKDTTFGRVGCRGQRELVRKAIVTQR